MKSIYQVIVLLTALFHGSIVNAQGSSDDKISISVDFESAQAIVRLMLKSKADTNEISRVAALYGNRQLIAKVKGYSGAGEEQFKSTLKEIIETGTVKGKDLYNWNEVKKQLPAIKEIINYLTTQKNQFLNEVKALIRPYVPDTLTADACACFLVGGGALGFTFGGDPTFNVALQAIGNDRQGLKYLVAHELYHSLQERGQNTRKKESGVKAPDSILTTYYLIANLWLEGSANLVADMSLIPKPGPFSKTQQVGLKKNEERKRENFALMEALLFRQFYDTAASYATSYNIAFTTGYDELGYSVGYDIAKMIIKYKGQQGLAKIVVRDPLLFIKDYIELYNTHKDDKAFVRFSRSTEEIIEKLEPWMDKL